MLYLNPPYFLIDGVSIFPDHADHLQFYYLPMMPHLTTTKDAASGTDVPSIQLIEYAGAAGTGGFINFDVNLGLDPSVLTTVAQKLKQQANLSDNPRLSPVTFIDGNVRLTILGAQSPAPPPPAGTPTSPARGGGATPAPAAATGPRFVIGIEGATKPSLYGDNQASFSVQLDQYGATVLEAALKGQIEPIAVIYALDFVGLRPAFRVHLHVDWSRVQTYLDSTFHTGFLFFSSDVEKAVDKLVEDQVISLSVDTFVTDDDGGKDIAGDRDKAMAEVYDMVKNTFFQSSLAPPDPSKPSTLEQADGVAQSIGALAMTGGAASMACFSYKSVDLTRIDNKMLDVNISVRTSVERTIYPQAHLSGLLGSLGKGGVGLDRFIQKVDLDNPWFQRRTLKVTSFADYDGDAIGSIDVTMAYNGGTKTVSLTKANPSASVDWSSVLSGGKMVRPVTYSYKVNFNGVDTAQRPAQLTSAALTEVGDSIAIQPRATLYSTTIVPIRADSFRWDRYTQVEIAYRYDDDANQIHIQNSLLLNNQTPEYYWPLFIRDPSKRTFSYQLTYTEVSGNVVNGAWQTTDAGKIDIVDPFPAKSTLMIVPAVNWNLVDQVLVAVAYPNKDNPAAQQNYVFTSANSAAQTFTADRQDPTQVSISYEARILMHNGQVGVIPPSVTTDDFLTVQSGMKGHQVLTIKPEQVDFASVHVVEANVQVRYVDPNNHLNLAKSYKFVRMSDVQHFTYDYLDSSVSPEFRADIQLDNGQTTSLDWAAVDGNTITLGLSQLS